MGREPPCVRASTTPAGALGVSARHGQPGVRSQSQFSKQQSTHVLFLPPQPPLAFQDTMFSAERPPRGPPGNGWRQQGRWEGGIKDALGDVGWAGQASTPQRNNILRGAALAASFFAFKIDYTLKCGSLQRANAKNLQTRQLIFLLKLQPQCYEKFLSANMEH